ncbi:hypothetical protein AN690_0200685 [Citrobacter freundii]|jgi:hypothetical protein|nr:hypothetical protein [Salmonella enterica]OCO64332.1 hypothetical protein AN688_0202525 [Citrobacter freundii]OEH35921.1 hypothetical protein AN690_0200685 [Citrobacter freundii]
MAKPRILFRRGRWLVTSAIYPGNFLVKAEGASVADAWSNYVKEHNICTNDYVNALPGKSSDVYFVEMRHDCISLIAKFKRFIRG